MWRVDKYQDMGELLFLVELLLNLRRYHEVAYCQFFIHVQKYVQMSEWLNKGQKVLIAASDFMHFQFHRIVSKIIHGRKIALFVSWTVHIPLLADFNNRDMDRFCILPEVGKIIWTRCRLQRGESVSQWKFYLWTLHLQVLIWKTFDLM